MVEGRVKVETHQQKKSRKGKRAGREKRRSEGEMSMIGTMRVVQAGACVETCAPFRHRLRGLQQKKM